MDKIISACGELLQCEHDSVIGNKARGKSGNSYAGRSPQRQETGVTYSSAPQVAVSSHERLCLGPGKWQSGEVKYPSHAEGRKVFINVLLTHGPTVTWSSSAVLYHEVSYF